MKADSGMQSDQGKGRAAQDGAGFGSEELHTLLISGIHPMRQKIELPLVNTLKAEMEAALTEKSDPLGAASALLAAWVQSRFDRISELHVISETFGARVGRAPDNETRNQHILDYARALGANERQLKGDARAFARWFGLDAVAERYRKGVAGAEREACFGLERLGIFVAAHVRAFRGPAGWRRVGIEKAALRAMDYPGDARVRTAAYSCLRLALEPVLPASREELLGAQSLRRIYRAAYQQDPEIGSQTEGLQLLRMMSPSAFHDALRQRLTNPAPGDDFWLRRRAIALLCETPPGSAGLFDLVDSLHIDPSPAARQGLAANLHLAPVDVVARHLPILACEDAAAEVRALVMTTLPRLREKLPAIKLAQIWCRVMRGETNAFVLRVAFETAAEGASLFEGADRQIWVGTLSPEIERLHVEAESLPVRRWAAQAQDRIWCASDPDATDLLAHLQSAVSARSEGESVRLKRLKETVSQDPELVTRVLSVMAQSDFGYDLTPGKLGRAPRLRRGDRFGFRLWRAWYEFRHPSSDKRQAFPHTIGRITPGLWHAPSSIMAELAETKVPGEPLFIAGDGGWRPYLPLPDHALSAIDTGQSVRIVTSEGVTEMTPPRGFLRRIRSRLALSFRFSSIAALRNWTDNRNHPPSAYIKALEELGFCFALRPHPEQNRLDPSVARFFGFAPFALVLSPDLWRRIETHFFSVYQNTLGHLAVFIGATLTWFVGRHLWTNLRIRRTRKALPLVLGGWGTRGKSGTERIKAGVINALGYSLVSKTTGNEAMFLYGYPFGPVKEMFLFRPYDKATIWEQADIARLATRLKGDVFLWECMGLTPAYVKVLQRHWMRDDVSTITNTYPDHEDVQGPAGRNIPEVMTNFIPKRGRLLTSEEQMRPILADAARDLGTSIDGVGWLEAGLLPADALQRFPYEEHPFNIALVLRMSEEIGIERDFALKEMADRVVPDLGVLKAYPVATMQTRRLEFVMGMSANERFGALGNWTRMGFDKQDPYAEPGVFVTAVVNNRADRVPRSRVFADLLVNDVSLDRIVLIGSNLKGLRGYLEEAWEARAPGLTLWPPSEDGGSKPEVHLEAAARRMRIAFRDAHIVAGLRAMLEGLPVKANVDATLALNKDPESLKAALGDVDPALFQGLLAHLQAMRQTAEEYNHLSSMLKSGGDRAKIDRAYRETLHQWFKRKIVVVENYYATGDQIIDVLREVTPPGYLNRIIGMQNIKGTGLDFVYRWQAWDNVHAACEMAESPDPLISAEGIQTLVSFQEYGIAAEERVRATVAKLREGASDGLDANLDLIIRSLEQQLSEARQGLNATHSSGPMSKVLGALEAFLDAGDAVRRRKKTERIYRDMIHERISHERAARELKKLNSRQKGGWLTEDLAGYREAVHRWWQANPKLMP